MTLTCNINVMENLSSFDNDITRPDCVVPRGTVPLLNELMLAVIERYHVLLTLTFNLNVRSTWARSITVSRILIA